MFLIDRHKNDVENGVEGVKDFVTTLRTIKRGRVFKFV